jgi:peptidoglycan/xylan/chitin deacetylase (PgdA/CDA1 family)
MRTIWKRALGLSFATLLLLMGYRAEGLRVVNWSVDSEDWASKGAPNQIANLVLKQVMPGDVILLHEQRQTLQALPTLLRRMQAKGYRFELLP